MSLASLLLSVWVSRWGHGVVRRIAARTLHTTFFLHGVIKHELLDGAFTVTIDDRSVAGC